MEMFIAAIAFLNSFPIIEFQATASSASSAKSLTPPSVWETDTKKDKASKDSREGFWISNAIGSALDCCTRYLSHRRTVGHTKESVGGTATVSSGQLEKLSSIDTISDVGTASDAEADLFMDVMSYAGASGSRLVGTEASREDKLILNPALKNAKQSVVKGASGKLPVYSLGLDSSSSKVEWISGHPRSVKDSLAGMIC